MNKLIIMLPRIHEVFTKGLLGRVRPGERPGRFLSYCHGGQTWNVIQNVPKLSYTLCKTLLFGKELKYICSCLMACKMREKLGVNYLAS